MVGETVQCKPVEVVVGDRGLDRAIKHLKRKMANEGILRELKRRRHYMKPSIKRRKKEAEAARRRRKRGRRKDTRIGRGELAGEAQRAVRHDYFHVRNSRTGRIAYVHFRNVVGVVPSYKEVFVDEGDTDMLEAVRILARNGYRGVLIPDHTPLVDCDAPWHAGVAFALGWMRAALRSVDALDDSV